MKLFLESNVLLSMEGNPDKYLMSIIENFLPKGKSILEISCGNGSDSKYLKDIGYNVTCTDINPEYVKHCKELGLNCFQHDTKQKFPFDESTFDLVYSRLGLHYFTKDELSKILTDIHRITKKYLLFTVKLEDNEPTGKIILNESDWRDLLSDGFKIKSLEIKSGKLYNKDSVWMEIFVEKK